MAVPIAAAMAPLAAQAFDFREAPDGVSCRYYDVALQLDWPGGAPRWLDARGRVGGPEAFDQQQLRSGAAQQVLQWDVTALVRRWAAGEWPNEGLVVAGVGGTGAGAQFHARESPDVGARPTLKLTHGNGSVELLSPAADTVLDCSTYTGIGTMPTLSIGPRNAALLRFDLARARKGPPSQVRSAHLLLVRTPVTPWAYGPLAVYRPLTPFSEPAPAPRTGLAAAFPGDAGIERHPAVIFADRFDAARLSPRWTPGDPSVRFAVGGGSLRGRVPTGGNLGLDLRFDFKRQTGQEPDAVHLRYCLRLDAGWLEAADGGKLPGLAGTYGRAGWGGRAWDGQQGWSARGAFLPAPPAGHPMQGHIGLGSYLYHGANTSPYGDVETWGGGHGAALLPLNRRACIEQRVQLNTPGHADGVLQAWVDGVPVFERTGLRLRDAPMVHIENAWMNVYFGGTGAASRDMGFEISQVVIATAYIGPPVAAR